MASFYTPIPNSPFYSPTTYTINSGSGPLVVGSGLAVDQFGNLLAASGAGGTVTAITFGTGFFDPPTTITSTGTVNLLPATASSLGGVKAGANVTIAPDGTLSVAPPGAGTISAVVAGAGLSGGGVSGAVTLSLQPATNVALGGVITGPGLNNSSGAISVAQASTTAIGGVRLATAPEVITGTDALKVVTPQTLAAKVASTTAAGLVQLSDAVGLTDSTTAATPTAVTTVYTAAQAAQATASAALPKTGGTMTGVITFSPSQTFPGVAFPVATTNSLGVVSVGPGLSVNSSGVLSTSNVGTVTAVQAGPGLGNPATGGTISTSGTLRLLAPTADGLQLGGVKAGANINIAFDGTISVPGSNFIASNNPSAFNGYIWPAPLASPALPFPGINGQVLTVLNSVAGTIGWTSAGTLQSVTAGTGVTVASTPTTATVSLAPVPSITPGNYGGTALIPVLAVNAYGQITSTGLANPFTSFQTPTVTAPFILVLNFTTNSTNWQWVLQGNTTIENPLNAVPGQRGALKISQNPSSTYGLTWGTSWKFANFAPYAGSTTLAAVDLIEFTVVAANYIVVTNIVQNIG
jgi:hypothetical protein